MNIYRVCKIGSYGQRYEEEFYTDLTSAYRTLNNLIETEQCKTALNYSFKIVKKDISKGLLGCTKVNNAGQIVEEYVIEEIDLKDDAVVRI